MAPRVVASFRIVTFLFVSHHVIICFWSVGSNDDKYFLATMCGQILGIF